MSCAVVQVIAEMRGERAGRACLQPAESEGLNLLYKDWGANSLDEISAARAGPRQLDHASKSGSTSFAFPSDAAVLGIFQKYTTLGEFLADAIAGRKIAPLARGLAFGHKLLDFRVVHAAGCIGIAQRLKFSRVVVFHHREHVIKVR